VIPEETQLTPENLWLAGEPIFNFEFLDDE